MTRPHATSKAGHSSAANAQAASNEGGLRRWLLFTVPLLAVGLAVLAGITVEREASTSIRSGDAPAFELPTTHGDQIALDDVLAEGFALTYFSMGVGCDGCFAQIPEISEALAERGIELVSIMPGTADALAFEADRFGIEQPILVDGDNSVADAYGMLGQYGHGDSPSHSFALISPDGTIEQTIHYPTMFVPLEQLLEDLELA